MPETPHPLTWRKSTYSGPNDENCVEVAPLAKGMLAMRDSKNPNGATLTFTSREWKRFIIQIKSSQIR